MTQKRIAIIGAGPSGIAFADAIAKEPNASELFTIDVIERQPKSGGLWCYTGSDKKKYLPSVPSTTTDEAIELPTSDALTPEDRFVSAMYQHLETNIVKQMMKYKDFPLPDECEQFPTRQEIVKYLQDFTATISDLVKFIYNSNVISMTKINDEWEIVYEDIVNGGTVTNFYDSVILAHGHFDLPYIPDVAGLKGWKEKDPQGITHAKYYNTVHDFENKTVLVIGNSASGIDISTQLSTYAKKVIVSATSPSPVADITIEAVDQIDKVEKYDYEDNRSVTTSSGKRVEDIDVVIFCTGYLYAFPFLKSYLEGDESFVSDGSQVKNVYKELFYIPDPSLIGAVLPKNVIPFPFAQCQAQYVARILSGRLSLPSKDEMYEKYNKQIKVKGAGKTFHAMAFPEDVDYCNDLLDSIKGTEDEGFVAEYWGPDRRELRGKTSSLKQVRLKKIVEHAQYLKKKHQPFYLLRGELKTE